MNNKDNNSNKSAAGICPICKTQLTVNRPDSCLLCDTCNRRYYVNADYNEVQKQAFNEYDSNDDLITASSISNQGPILISSTHEMEDFALKSDSRNREGGEGDPICESDS